MGDQIYRAALSRSQKRSSWCIIFRHPLRFTPNGKPGLRVRRGLGTSDEAEAQRLVDQMNEILSEEKWWTPTLRAEAERLFDSRIVHGFYQDLMPTERDSWALRDSVIALPDRTTGYIRTLLLGTTGAGKTTLVRQLIGTDPVRERFPSTSAAKTTIADQEIVLDEGPEYRAVVTFLTRDQTRRYIEECILAAIMAHLKGSPLPTVADKLLEHSLQRFRLSYILGSLYSTSPDEEQDEFADDVLDEAIAETTPEDRHMMAKQLQAYLESLQQLAQTCRLELEEMLQTSFTTTDREEREVLEELIEDLLLQHDGFHQLADEIADDVETRFELLSVGTVEKNLGGWPSYWSYSSPDRNEFIQTINRFSSNYAPNFGRLLTPLVEGIRVAGPFLPEWATEMPRLVLMDGEGLGHTPDSMSSVSTKITRRYEIADAILIVDNATQPMQAVPFTILRSLASTGHEEKMVLCFTHFDGVQGLNMPTTSARMAHVRASVDNVLTALGGIVGRSAENALKLLARDNVVFLSGIDASIVREHPTGSMRLSHAEFDKLLNLLQKKIQEPEPAEVHPVYNDTNLVLTVQKSMQEFHQSWSAILGLGYRPGVKPEHWTRIKALTRRLGELREEEYDTLRPVADLKRELDEHIRRFLDAPVEWHPGRASDEKMRTAINAVARQVSVRTLKFASERLFLERVKDWAAAYSRRGAGSTRVRAKDIELIYNAAAPVPGEIDANDANQFVREVRQLVREALHDGGGKLIQD